MFALFSLSLPAQNKTPVPIIFDSDMGPDYDDVGAIALLHTLADSGYAKILATIASTRYEGVASILNIFNTYFNREDIPVGVAGETGLTLKDSQHWTDSLIAGYPHRIKSNREAWDAVRLYRKILSEQKRHSVTIVTTGFLTNLHGLLLSKGDEYSPLDGPGLVLEKVKKLVCMAGKFPEGYEFNIDRDIPAARYVFTRWPGFILFSGFEIGERIKTGLPLVNNKGIKHSPVQDVFRISIPMAAEDSAGRKSWDETAVLVAVLGYRPFYRLLQGHILVDTTGKSTWDRTGGNQAYLLETSPAADVAAYINKALMRQPVK